MKKLNMIETALIIIAWTAMKLNCRFITRKIMKKF